MSLTPVFRPRFGPRIPFFAAAIKRCPNCVFSRTRGTPAGGAGSPEVSMRASRIIGYPTEAVNDMLTAFRCDDAQLQWRA